MSGRPKSQATVVDYPVQPRRVAALQRRLLDWFAASARDLPWRRTRDPYAIWLSEVMLQQTQVATVIPYWERYLERFPTVQALASAPQADVLALWSGLGYYARARNLHLAAKQVVERHAGTFPASVEDLRALAGFGPYTAGAVASIAFGLDAPLVDGNVVRVLCRVEGWELGAEDAARLSWAAARALLPAGRASDWNQALMELGATVCAPKNPACGRCPVASVCKAAQTASPALYPLPKKRPVKKRLRLAAVCVTDEAGRVVLVKNEAKGLFGGLWSLPLVEIGEADADGPAVMLARSILGEDASLARVPTVLHTLTHRDVVVEMFTATGRMLALPEGGQLVPLDGMHAFGLSTLTVKMLGAAHLVVPGNHGRRRAVSSTQPTLFGGPHRKEDASR